MPSYLKNHTLKLLNILIYLPFIWLGTGLCLVEGGRSIMTKLMVIAVVSLLILYKKQAWSWVYKTRQQLYTSTAMLAFVVYLALLQAYHGADEGLIRTIGLLTLYYYLFPLHLFNNRWVIAALLLNAIGLGYLIYQNAYLHNIPRLVVDETLMNPIPFATYCMLAFITQVYYAIKAPSIYLKFLLLIGSLVSIAGMLLTESRGVALALSVIIILVTINLLMTKSRTFIISTISISIITTIFIGILLKDTFTLRYNQTKNEIHQIQKGNLNTSIGLRFQFWASGLDTLAHYPIIGVGNDHFRSEFKRQYDEGKTSLAVLRYNTMHYHNLFLDIAVKNGILGLFLFTLILFLIYKGSQNTLPKLLILSIIIAGLTDVPTSHLALMYFTFMLILFSNQFFVEAKDSNKLENRS